MPKNLVIVESPAKVKTIKKFLGEKYNVMASKGHVRDMPKSQLGIGPENDFEPKYITIRGKGPVLAELRKAAKNADNVYLATDPDREGEAISWHLTKSLKLEGKKVNRITFNEITKAAVKESLKNARAIDMNLVDSQQARRALDRIVGYKISPLLWCKVKNGLSAGRVQSATLRIICDREEEINAFITKEYWTLEGDFSVKDEKNPLQTKFYGKNGKKADIHSQEELDIIMDELQKAEYYIEDIKNRSRTRKAPLPFTTSTLQQEASKTLNFSTQKTMGIAQQLYEGIAIKGHGTTGLITYLRTDSTRVSITAEETTREYIENQYGKQYVSEKSAQEVKTGRIQDSHEAIRPTDIKRTPASVKDFLSNDQFRLYRLIWQRFTASMMKHSIYDTITVKICGGEYSFTAATSKLAFDGFMAVYKPEEEKEDKVVMPKGLSKGSSLFLKDLKKQQHFTQPPAHFTEATLVKALEEYGIGRPSTYSPIITTLLKRRYIIKENKNLYITEIGEVVNRIMKDAFPSIVDTMFTATMEELLDFVAEGKTEWKAIIRNFYPDIDEAVEKAGKELAAVEIKEEETDEICDKCGRNMVIKYGPYGRFLACPGFPECRNTKLYLEKINVACPICGNGIVMRTTRKGRRYYGCENNPECGFMSWQKPLNEKCPVCGSHMVEKGKKVVCSEKKCAYTGGTLNA